MSPKFIRDQFFFNVEKNHIPDKLTLKRFKYKSPDHNLHVHKLKQFYNLKLSSRLRTAV